jgi:hypothetical protein
MGGGGGCFSLGVVAEMSDKWAGEAATKLVTPCARSQAKPPGVPTAHLQLWLPDLSAPPAWTVAAVDGATVTRLLLRRLNSGTHWDGCEVLNLYRVPGAVPESLVLDNADHILRDSAATDIRSCQLEVAPRYGVIATRASGVLHSGDRVVRSQFHNYVVNTNAGGALIEQAIVIGAEMLSALESEVNERTENLYRSLLTSIDRAPHRGQA